MLTDPPGQNEIEVSIFGPGKGESILVHLTFGDWIIVDSCVDQLDRTIPALTYLDTIGVDLNSVKLVVGTHAHDDHIAGLADVFEACKSSIFVSSSALVREEFFALLDQDLRIEQSLRESTYREYRKINSLEAERSRTEGRSRHRRASENRELFVRQAVDGGPTFARVRSLSPSDEAVTRAIERLAKSAATAGSPRRAFAADPNELAIAMWVEVADKSILLGADLLSGPARCGWSAILDFFEPSPTAGLYKVPHHGSPNSDHPGVWETLLQPKPISILAPYRAGVTPRSSRDDISRLRQSSSAMYITASPEQIATSRAVRRAAASLSQLGQNVRDPWGRSGHVRARIEFDTPGSEWQVDTSPPGRQLV